MAAENIIVGSCYTWYATIKKNSAAAPTTFAAWNLSSPSTATITVNFIKPAGTRVSGTAAIVVAADGTADFTNLAATFDVAGTWAVSWKVVQGSVVMESKQRTFTVYASAAAATAA